MKISRLALVVIAANLLFAGNAVGQDEKKAESDADVVLFEYTLAKTEGGDKDAVFNLSKEVAIRGIQRSSQ